MVLFEVVFSRWFYLQCSPLEGSRALSPSQPEAQNTTRVCRTWRDTRTRSRAKRPRARSESATSSVSVVLCVHLPLQLWLSKAEETYVHVPFSAI